MKSLIIIPTFNERENIEKLVPIILDQPPHFDILIVDDASPDGTGEVVEQLAATTQGRVRVLHRPAKLGLGSAYVEGFRWALARDYELIFQMDADFSHDPMDLVRFVAAAASADVVIGSRYVKGGATIEWSRYRRAISQGGAMYTRALLRLPYHDVTTGYRCYHRAVLERLDLDHMTTTGFGFQVEMLYRCYQMQARVVELPIVFHRRRIGQSKMSANIFVEAMALVWRLRQDGSKDPPRPLSAPGC